MNIPNTEHLRQFAKELDLEPDKIHTVTFKMWVLKSDPTYPYVGTFRIWDSDLEADGYLFNDKASKLNKLGNITTTTISTSIGAAILLGMAIYNYFFT